MRSSTFAIVNGSCDRRREEIRAISDFLAANGLRERADVREADCVVFFACGGMRVNVDDMLSRISDVSRQMKPGAELVVGGCLPAIDPRRLARVFSGRTITWADCGALDDLPGVTAGVGSMPPVFGPAASPRPLVRRRPLAAGALRLVDLASRVAGDGAKPGTRRLFSRLGHGRRLAVSVAAGCLRECPYCAKRFGFGALRSKPLDVVLGQIRDATRFGFRAFDLLADSIGDYGQDLGTSFAALLDGLSAFDPPVSVGICDLHPQDFLRDFDRLASLAAAGRLHYLYVTVESGSARLLRSMGRPVDPAEVAGRLIALRESAGRGAIFLRTTIMVGYPGETDADFDETLALLERVGFDHVFVHPYCDMPGTPSSLLDGKVSHEAQLRRLERLAARGVTHSVEDARVECDHAFARDAEDAGSGTGSEPR